MLAEACEDLTLANILLNLYYSTQDEKEYLGACEALKSFHSDVLMAASTRLNRIRYSMYAVKDKNVRDVWICYQKNTIAKHHTG